MKDHQVVEQVARGHNNQARGGSVSGHMQCKVGEGSIRGPATQQIESARSQIDAACGARKGTNGNRTVRIVFLHCFIPYLIWTLWSGMIDVFRAHNELDSQINTWPIVDSNPELDYVHFLNQRKVWNSCESITACLSIYDSRYKRHALALQTCSIGWSDSMGLNDEAAPVERASIMFLEV